MKNFSQFWEGYVASADKKVGKDGKLRPAKHIKTQARDEDEKEVVEKLDLKKADMGDVIKDFQDSDAPQFKGKSDEKKRQMAIAAKLAADGKSKNEEVDQLDELSKQTLGSYVKKASNDSAAKAYSSASAAKDNNPEKGGKDFVKSRQRQKGIEKATDRLTKEELKGNQHKLDKNKNGKLDADDFKKLRKEDMTPEQKRKRLEMIRKSAQKLNRKAEMDAKRAMRSDPVLGRRPKDESVEEAVGTSAKYAGKSGMFGGKYTSSDHAITTKNFSKYRDDRSQKRDAQHKAQDPAMQKKGYAKHMVDLQKAKKKAAARGVDPSKTARSDYHNRNGITPNRKLPEEMDNEMQKKDMMKTQLHFIKYAADEICEYIDMGGNIEEWYQNKVSKAFADFESLHSYMEGTARKDGLKEEIKEGGPGSGRVTSKDVKMGIGIARDKRYAGGNYTGATKVMDKIKKGLADHPRVKDELRKQNEEHLNEDDGYYAYQKAKAKYHKDNPGSNFDRAPEHHKQKYIHPEMQKRGYKKVGSTWVKEEALDELSKNTLASYSAKASDQAGRTGAISTKKQDNRIAGIKTAAKKMEEDTHVVMYHDKDGKHVNNSKPMTADKAKAHADKGNKIDKVGGKYIVKKINEADKPPFTPDPPKKNATPQRNSDGSITSPMSKAKQLAKQAVKNAEKTVAQHKEGVEFDEDGNLLEAKNKITFHQFMGATKKKDDKTKNKEAESTDPTRL